MKYVDFCEKSFISLYSKNCDSISRKVSIFLLKNFDADVPIRVKCCLPFGNRYFDRPLSHSLVYREVLGFLRIGFRCGLPLLLLHLLFSPGSCWWETAFGQILVYYNVVVDFVWWLLRSILPLAMDMRLSIFVSLFAVPDDAMRWSWTAITR